MLEAAEARAPFMHRLRGAHRASSKRVAYWQNSSPSVQESQGTVELIENGSCEHGQLSQSSFSTSEIISFCDISLFCLATKNTTVARIVPKARECSARSFKNRDGKTALQIKQRFREVLFVNGGINSTYNRRA